MTFRWLGLALLLLPSAAAAQWYTWHDASGTVHVINQATSEPPAPAAPPGADATPRAPVAASDDLRQRLTARLADRRAHLQLLRAAGSTDPTRMQLENILADEIRQDAARLELTTGAPRRVAAE